MHALKIWKTFIRLEWMWILLWSYFLLFFFRRSISLGWISFNAKHTVLIIKPNMSHHQAQTQQTDNVRASVPHIVYLVSTHSIEKNIKWWVFLIWVRKIAVFWVDFSTCSHNNSSLLISHVVHCAHMHIAYLVILYQDSVYLCLSCIQMHAQCNVFVYLFPVFIATALAI